MNATTAAYMETLDEISAATFRARMAQAEKRDNRHAPGIVRLAQGLRRHAQHHYYDDPGLWASVLDLNDEELVSLADGATSVVEAILNLRRTLDV